MGGFDRDLIRNIYREINVPLTVLGGAGSLSDICKIINEHKIIGIAAGSIFVFKGKHKDVLVNYPSQDDKLKILKGLL